VPGQTLTVEVADATGRLSDQQVAYIARFVHAAANLLRVSGQLRVRVVDDAEMATAHEEFAGVPGTTDVLTFDLTDPEQIPDGRPLLTAETLFDARRPLEPVESDIFICVDEAGRQAAKRGYSVERELLLYVVHGLLHCLGLDDHDEEDFWLMHRMEDVILERIGVGRTFAGDERANSDGTGSCG